MAAASPTASHAELGKNVGDVNAGGLLGDAQLPANLPVALSGYHERKHLGLPSVRPREAVGNGASSHVGGGVDLPTGYGCLALIGSWAGVVRS